MGIKMLVSFAFEIGALVGLKRSHKDPDVQGRLDQWIKAESRGPFVVFAHETPWHVSLQDMGGRVIHFGSTCNPSLHADYVELWKG
jgi:hypothetical protein